MVVQKWRELGAQATVCGEHWNTAELENRIDFAVRSSTAMDGTFECQTATEQLPDDDLAFQDEYDIRLVRNCPTLLLIDYKVQEMTRRRLRYQHSRSNASHLFSP